MSKIPDGRTSAVIQQFLNREAGTKMVPTSAASTAEAGLRAAGQADLTRAARRVTSVRSQPEQTGGRMTKAVAPDGAAMRLQGEVRRRAGKRSLPSKRQDRANQSREGGGENRVGARLRRHKPPPHARQTTRPATAAEMAARLVLVSQQ